MSEAFNIERIRTRLFRATHLASGQEFELRGRQDVHFWSSHRIEKGIASKHVYTENWQSKKLLLVELNTKILQEMQRAARLAQLEIQKNESLRIRAESRGITRYKPEIYAELKRKLLVKGRTLLFAPKTNERFILYNIGKEGYRIEFETKQKQPICTGMATEDEAILELYYYLDDGDDPQLYCKESFRKR